MFPVAEEYQLTPCHMCTCALRALAGSVWSTFHFEQGLPCAILIADIAKFLHSTTHEVIVVEVSHTSGAHACHSHAACVRAAGLE